ncbi:phosphatidylserine/phosphatidylglycerophosphate/cardiolipin synthase-like enzyme [Maribacter vaceletii]|uniref:Phosphatidylserine/phosphatidylglycerophosphate/ cardiolipin synthase-like enzyme n=1 Tax=Maribacter vaceletii TaxID=1206816 RepID=A0A495E5U6_9FLAO|nr:phospholipase D family protein [Maribacter vaceletii]RKR12315.1 phosphatidylserine/phosphatidylglycerophosphate/cardiolipin synthase-like enzyme [Maribacter vaceletii]
MTKTSTNCQNIKRDTTISLSAALKEVKPLMQDKTGVYVLEDGGTAMVTRAWLCEYAEKSIDIQYFIFSTDNIGLIASDYLVRAADRGVKVRLLIDDIMVDGGFKDILSLNAHENIEIRIYNPGVNLGKNIFQKIGKFATDFRSANQRMHNKTFVVDKQVVITGGRNIADEYFDYDHEYNFRDRDVLLLGKETKQINTSFQQFWDSDLSVPAIELTDTLPEELNDKDRFSKLHEYACNPENFWPQVREKIQNLPQVFKSLKESDKLVWTDSVSFVSDFPGKNDGESGLGGGGITTSKLLKLVKSAKKSIEIQTPYLITSELGKNLFKEVVERGVKVRILTNSLASTDNVEAFSSYQTDREALLETGVKIYEFKPDAAEQTKIMTGALQEELDYKPTFGLHAKSMVIDGKTTIIGTFNLDPRSANLNTECITIINSKEITKFVLEGMEEEFKPENSWHITLDYNPDSEVSNYKRLKTWTRKILPKDIL